MFEARYEDTKTGRIVARAYAETEAQAIQLAWYRLTKHADRTGQLPERFAFAGARDVRP